MSDSLVPATASFPPATPWIWGRDFAFVGGISGLFAPACVISFGHLAVAYLFTSTLAGIVTGVGVGLATRRLLTGRLRRIPKIAWLPLGTMLGTTWGGIVGLAAGVAAALSSGPDWRMLPVMGGFSAFIAALVGAAQLGWFWLAYSFLRVRRRPVALALALSLVVPLWLLGSAAIHASLVLGVPLLPPR